MSNILIDLRTAELVHIDLGIAFEAGKLLKTPEMVPFRLTRDLEDALGVCGVEGVLRSGAEHTMRVLRSHTDALLTVLQVFVRNPLHKWTQDPTRAKANPFLKTAGAGAVPAAAAAELAAAGGSGSNAEAERTLLRIQHKLEGHAQSSSQLLSVEGQVRALLDEARDPENLSRMFDGWAAWL